MPERYELHQRLANDLYTLAEGWRSFEREEPNDSWLDSPEHSFITYLNLIADARSFFVPTEAGPALGSYHNRTPENLAAAIGNRIFELAETAPVDKSIPELQRLLQTAIRSARKELVKSEIPKQLLACDLLGYIALYVKPQGITSNTILKKHKHETAREQTFRMAMDTLRQFSDQTPTKAEKKTVELIESRHDTLATTSFTKAEIAAFNRHAIKTVASQVRMAVLLPTFSAEEFSEELNAWAERINRREAQQHAIEALPTEETSWTILPPEITDQLWLPNLPSNSDASSTPETLRVHPERLRWLGEIAVSWGESARIAVANLDATGNYDYRVAVLPQRLPDGRVIEHAVAENPAIDNAVYIFRGERGLDRHGNVQYTWRDAFKDNRRSAKALGARRMLHVPTLHENVIEYLTRHPDDLDNPRYRR